MSKYVPGAEGPEQVDKMDAHLGSADYHSSKDHGDGAQNVLIFIHPTDPEQPRASTQVSKATCSGLPTPGGTRAGAPPQGPHLLLPPPPPLLGRWVPPPLLAQLHSILLPLLGLPVPLPFLPPPPLHGLGATLPLLAMPQPCPPATTASSDCPVSTSPRTGTAWWGMATSHLLPRDSLHGDIRMQPGGRCILVAEFLQTRILRLMTHSRAWLPAAQRQCCPTDVVKAKATARSRDAPPGSGG